MSWTNELYQVYETFHDQEEMLPISHSTAKAQIELTIQEDGTFVTARRLAKEEAETVIPVTEDSGTRTSGICPMPYADKLVYIAGDYGKYAEGKRADNREYYDAYMKQLKSWDESSDSHPAVHALLLYLHKRCLMQDLVSSDVLHVSAESGKLKKEKIDITEQEDCFVRFRVNYMDIEQENCTWKDKSLQNSFIAYQQKQMVNRQLCYATGTECAISYKHPAKVRNAGDKAKLISSNDESGFTYRGRFANKEEAFAMGYVFSQKIHNALKWLIRRQGVPYGSLVFVIWASALQPLPRIDTAFSQMENDLDDDLEESAEDLPTTAAIYRSQVKKLIWGYQKKLDVQTKVMVMGLDAATTGRLSIAMYTELDGSVFLQNLEQWHCDAAWKQYHGKKKCNLVDSFSPYDIIRCAMGTEQDGKLKCKPEIIQQEMLRLFPCITEGRNVPQHIVRNLVIRASNPLAYKPENYNHRKVLATACAMIRKQNLEKQKGMTSMELDKNYDDRSYLFGRLLAVSDKLERDTYEKEEKRDEKRVTNAHRLWNTFSQRPYRTWKILRERLIPYMNKLGKRSVWYQKEIQEICEKMSPEVFSSAAPLEPLYLLGYDHEMKSLYNRAETVKNAENEEE